MGDLRYAIHSYAWTSSWRPEDVAIVDHAASLGLDALEVPLMELEHIDPGALRERAAAAGIELLTSTACDERTDPTSDDERVRERALRFLTDCVDATAAMGATVCTGVVYSALTRPERAPAAAHRDRATEILRTVARHAAAKGVTVGIEPVNRYETALVNTAEQALDLIDRIGEDNVGVHLDTYHMNIEERDFSGPVRRVLDAERLVHVHLSESHRGVPGRGVVDWAAVMGELARGGYDGYVGLESFAEVAPALRGATCIWRDLAPDSDTVVREGLVHLKSLHRTALAA
jgi:D-psicose/D-tagatose/L-ribulose 3-epimerase